MVSGTWQKLYELLASRKLALVLFGATGLMAVPGTFRETYEIYSSPVFIAVLGALALNLLACSVTRIRSLPRPVLIMHLGIIVTLVGACISAFGYVGTVNVYEGKSVDTVYRWDRKEEMDLGATLTVKQVGMEYYPIPVKVGVLKNGEKDGLFVVKTGESFVLGPYHVTADSLDVPAKNLYLSLRDQGQVLGRFETAGQNELPAGFPYAFVLVAFKDPVPSRVWVSLSLSKGSEVVAEGITEANNPFTWGGLSFHNTEISHDAYGNRYAGIQITRDPGTGVVYTGFAITCLGAAVFMIRRLYGVR